MKRTQRTIFREILMVAAFAFVFFLMIQHAMGYLQLQKKNFLLAQAAQSAIRTESIQLPRATIYDRNGYPLAISSKTFTLGIDAQLYENNYANALRIAEATGLDAQEIISRVKLNPGSRFIAIKRKLSQAVAEYLRRSNIAGINLQSHYERFYPLAETAAQLIGITDTNEKGIGGLELAFDAQLRSKPGKQKILVSASGKIIKNLETLQPAQAGKPLYLSIDIRLQNLSYNLLQKYVDKVGAKSGSVLMLDVPTGEALVVANYPANNPNYRETYDHSLSKNRIFVDLIEPGSSIKPLSVAAVIANNTWSFDKPVPLPKGSLKTDNFNIRDISYQGNEISIHDILVKSSNRGAAILGLELGANKLINAYIDYGFSNTTGSGFPGEVIGKLPLNGTISKSRNATLSYGYGFSLTIAQLARAYLAIANNGRMSLIKLTKNSKSRAAMSEQVLDPKLAIHLRKVLTGVSQNGGTAPNTAVEGYTVAGKTGTAHKHIPGGYSRDKYYAIFVGMVPAKQPKLLAVVIVRLPQGDNYYGSESAAPIFQDLISNSLRILRINPAG